MEKTICDLFAGVGGFRLGFERASKDWKTVWFSQWEPEKKKQWAHDCYVSHFGDIDADTCVDIASVDKSSIPDHNILVAGFPCQDYSVARPLSDSKGIEGKKGVLWWSLRDVLEAKRPAFGLLENVDRLLKSPAAQRGRDFGIILACLSDLGYTVEWRVIDAANYGMPQRRRRVFIFFSRNDTRYSRWVSSFSPVSVMMKYGLFAKTFPVASSSAIGETYLLKDVAEVSERFTFTFGNTGRMMDGVIYTANTEPKMETPTPLRCILQSGVEEKYYLKGDLSRWKYLKSSKRIERVSKTGHRYIFSEGSLAFPDPIDRPARTMLTSESSLNRSSHVIEDPETERLRSLTPIEAERLQGFDDGWTDTGMPEKFRYFCMGNALVVPLITRMAKEIEKILESED